MKDKTSAGVFALVLGGLGVHHFYLGHVVLGLLYLCFCWTFIPAILGFIEGILFLTMSKETFDGKYNPHQPIPVPMVPQNIVVNVQNTATNGPPKGPSPDPLEQIRRLHELKVAGALSEEEFAFEKGRLLSQRGSPPHLGS